MDWGTVATTASASGVIAALVSGLFSEHSSKRTIQIENITKERAKWRDKIRELAVAIHHAAVERNSTALKEFQLSLSLNLNPTDPEDVFIIDAVGKLSRSEALDEKSLQEFSDRVALLLKHDWERAKVEAKQAKSATRITYAEFLVGKE